MRLQTVERCVATISGAEGSSLTHFAYDPGYYDLLNLEVIGITLQSFKSSGDREQDS